MVLQLQTLSIVFVRLHDGDELEVSKMRFTYDRAYGNINYGHTSGLTPYYKMLNLLLRYTLTPRGGDSDGERRRGDVDGVVPWPAARRRHGEGSWGGGAVMMCQTE
jgi:hypothetical protein